MKKNIATVGILLSGVAPLHAQTDEIFVLDEIVVSASLEETERSRTGATVTVVTQEELRESGETRVIEYLDRLPGVSASGNGGVGSRATLRLRGLPGRYVPVYIDGIDVTDPSSTQTAFNWGDLTTSGISRIEVLTGSQSALYGSEAIGGVINITTTRATELGTHYTAGIEAGSYDTLRAELGVTSKGERGELAFNLSHINTNGFSAADENAGNTEADGHESTALTFSGAYQATDTLKLGFTLLYQDSETEQDGGFPVADAAGQAFVTRKAGRVYAEIDGDVVDHSFSLSHSRTDRFFPVGFSQNFQGDRTEATYQGSTSFNDVKLAFGTSYTKEEFSVDAVSGSYDIASLFGEAQYAVNDAVDISLSLRHDEHSEYGSNTTGRLALAWRATPDTVVRASAATGFRAPSLYELFGPFGDPTLQPETSLSFELGVEQKIAGGSVRATVFHTEIDDLIGFAGGTYAQVPGTSVTRGIELAAALPISDRADFFGSYTYTNAEDQAGNQLVRVPEHDLVLGLEAELGGNWRGQVSFNHVAGRADDGGMAMGDYSLVNASVTYDISDNAEAYLRVENLLDEEYQTSAGYGTSDRAFYVGLRARF